MLFKHILLLGAGVSAFSGCQATTKTATLDADGASWCISGGPIYTALDAVPTVEAVAVRNGKITYVGNAEGEWCVENSRDNARKVDLQGSVMFPGFTDGHGHLIGIGLREMTLNLEGTASIAALKARLKAVAADTPKGETIYGRGWIETHWPEDRFPNRADLDAVSTDHPILIERSDGHAIVVNSKALQLSNITRETTSPEGGRINKDENGEPDGMLVDNASGLVSDLQAKLSTDRKREAYIKGAALYASRGWTGIHSMSVDPDDISLLEQLAISGDIKIRVYNAVDVYDGRDMPSAEIEPVENKQVITRSIKLYSDGALGSRGAALLAPYSDEPDNTGLMTLTKDEALSVYTAALRNGTQVCTHAIGDKANKTVLDWYETAFAAVPEEERLVKNPRWRIEHSQILDVADIPRFAALGVIPSMQPSHAIGDLHFAIDRLGEDRLAGGYAWRSLIDSGSIIVGGTDAPVEVGDPRIEFYAATRREDLKGFSGSGWNPQQRVTPQEALKMFTAWPAFASYQDKQIGTIEVGKWADFSIFEADIMTADAKTILNTKTKMTIVGGKVAYEHK